MTPSMPIFIKTVFIPSLLQLRDSDYSTFEIAMNEVNNNLLFVLEQYKKSDDLTLLVGRIANLIASYNTYKNDNIILSIIDLSDSYSSHANLSKFLYDLLNLQYSSIPQIKPSLH